MPLRATIAAATAARRRAFVADLALCAGQGAASGAGAALIGLAAARVLGYSFSDGSPWTQWPALAGGVVGLGVLAGIAAASMRRWSIPRAARELDTRLNLHDALSIAIQIEPRETADPFAGLAVARAESLAARANARVIADPAKAFRSRGWAWAAVLALGAAGVGLWWPARVIKPPTATTTPLAQAAREEARDAVAEASAVADTLPEVDDKDRALLRELEQELSSPSRAQASSRLRAAEAVDRVADSLEARARTERAVDDVLRRTLAETQQRRDTAASELAKSLARADLTSAAEAAESLKQAAQSLPPAEREKLAAELESLAQSLDAKSGQQPPEANPAEEAPQAGSPPDQPKSNSSSAEPQPRESPPPESSAPPDSGNEDTGPSETPAQLPKADGTQEQLKNLRDAARQAAEELRSPPPPKQEPPTKPDPAPEEPTRPKSDPSKPKSPPPTDGKADPSDPSKPREEKSPGSSKEPTAAGERAPKQDQQSSPQQPEQKREGSSPSKTPGPPQPSDKPGEKQPPDQTGEPKPGTQSGEGPKREQNADDPKQQPKDTAEGPAPKDQKPATPDKNGQPGSEPQAPKPEPKPESKPEPGSEQKTGTKSEPSLAPSGERQPQNTPQPGAKPEQGKTQDTKPEQSPEGMPQPGAQNREGATPAPQPSADPKAPNSAQPQPSPGTPDSRAKPQPQPGGQTPDSKSTPQAQPDAKPGTKPDPNSPAREASNQSPPDSDARGEQNAPSPQESEKPTDGLGKMAETLKQMAKHADQAKQSEQKSREMREQARKLMDSMSPQQKRELEQLARQLGKDPKGRMIDDAGSGLGPMVPPRTEANRPDLDSLAKEPVDMRPPGTPEGSARDRVLAEWDAPPRPGEALPASPGMNEGVRRAAEGVERAIEQQQVPPRYSDLVRRVFKKYVDRTQEPTPPPK